MAPNSALGSPIMAGRSRGDLALGTLLKIVLFFYVKSTSNPPSTTALNVLLGALANRFAT